MSNKKRTRLEVIHDILEVLRNGRNVKITHLIYKANLSSNTIKLYLNDLLKNSLIEEVVVEDKKFFRIREKGYEFLEEFGKIKVFAESYGL